MATTGMATEFVKNLLRAVPEEKSWAVGEALAESVLADDDTREICWPWNLVRDRRTLVVYASTGVAVLPGKLASGCWKRT